METGDIAHFEQFHFFSQCFPKAFSFNMLQLVYMEERVIIDIVKKPKIMGSKISNSMKIIMQVLK